MTYEDLIPTKEVAARRGVTVKTVNLWAQQGKLPVAATERLSGARLFDPEVVARFSPKTSPVVPVPPAGAAGDSVAPERRAS